MGLWQRLQLTGLRLVADVVFTSVETWAETLRGQTPAREVHHLPVGSNFPDRRSDRQRERRRLGVDDETLVVATMGRDHLSWLGEYVVEAVNAIRAASKPPVLLSLGADAPVLLGLDSSVETHFPGFLEPPTLASMLATADLFLVPLIDGVSTRRGTLMAALQHGLPVVGTAGPLTDSILRESESALRLVEVGDRGQFASEAVRLAGNPDARASIGTTARLLYENNFDWPVIVRKMLTSLPDR